MNVHSPYDSSLPIKSILLTGAAGLLGRRIVEAVGRPYELYRVYHTAPDERIDPFPIVADLTSTRDVYEIARREPEPDVLINCAAAADVDHCQIHEWDTYEINVEAVRTLQWQFPVARFVQISTDYVFGNWIDKASRPPKPTDRVRPRNKYGRQKRQAEKMVLEASDNNLVVRVNSLFDYQGRNNMFRYVYESLSRGEEVKAMTDQISNPISTFDAAALTVKLFEQGATGIFHLGGSDFVSRYEFACHIADFYGFDKKKIIPIKADAYPRPAPRPKKAGLDCSATEKLLNVRMPSLASAFTRIRNELHDHGA